jgi:DNA-binding XRE family transcriptional regulator
LEIKSEMTNNFRELYDKMSPERRAKIEKRVAKTIAEMPLSQLRQARNMTQLAMAEKLNVDQGSISKIEARKDMHISTLKEYVNALGGTLEIRAKFRDSDSIIEIAKNAGPNTKKQKKVTTAR